MATCYGFIDHGQILQEMSAEELEAKEKSYVKVRTSNGEKAAEYLSKELQLDASYNADDDTIYIYFENNAVYPTEKISRFLFERDTICTHWRLRKLHWKISLLNC